MSDALTDKVSVFRQPAMAAAGVYLLSGAVVVMAVNFGNAFLERQSHPTQNEPGFINSMTNWDGRWYTHVAGQGYTFSTAEYSGAAFFPVYPFLGRCVARITGLRIEVALLCVSHACLAAVFLLLGLYVRLRFGTLLLAANDGRSPTDPKDDPGSVLTPSLALRVGVASGPGLHSATNMRGRLEWTLLTFAFFPPTLFFRMAYTESLFMLCLVAAMYAMEREWPLLGVAAIVGLATGVRLVGAALLAPLALYAWDRFCRGRLRIVELALAPILGCWGIVAYMVYLQDRFGDPLAFVKAQGAWNRRPGATLEDYAIGLFSWEPLWAVFDPASPAYWGRYGSETSPLFNIQILNVFCFVFVAFLVIVGFWRGVLNGRETLLASLLLAIPYVTHSYQTLMWSEARFSSVVFPAYLVMGELACRLPAWLAAGLLALSAFLLGGYTALFASWHLVF